MFLVTHPLGPRADSGRAGDPRLRTAAGPEETSTVHPGRRPGRAADTGATATFRAGSGFSLDPDGGTDGLRQVSGSVTFRQAVSSGPIAATGTLAGLQPGQPYVTAPNVAVPETCDRAPVVTAG